nr:DEAD/DEAH box helicase family protein [uncultured Roseibium sp.]
MLVEAELSRTALALWPHQHAALDTVDAYLESASARACLVNMPTGTGKTGGMATLARQRAQDRAVLVVCPSKVLVQQLTVEIRGRFWDKIGADPA